MTKLQEDFILQERYLTKQLLRPFLFSTNHCRTFTGLDLDEIIHIHDKYVSDFAWRFTKLTSMEVLNALFVYFKTGESINWIRALVEKITGRTIRNEQISLAMRKVLFILGKSIMKHMIFDRSDMNHIVYYLYDIKYIVYLVGENEIDPVKMIPGLADKTEANPRKYHDVLELGTDLSKYGKFKRDHLNFDDSLFDLLRKKGASCLRIVH